MFGNTIHTEWGNIRLPKRKKENHPHYLSEHSNVEYYTDEKGQIKRFKMAKAGRK